MEKIIAYTDGACKGNPGPAGIGVVVIADKVYKYSQYLGDQKTNNIAELSAILLLLQIINDKTSQVEVYTDSNYVIGVLQKKHNFNKNIDLINQIKEELKKFKNIKFFKVKAHSTNYYNNLADQLAVNAIEDI
jgi:ribonuclease HI